MTERPRAVLAMPAGLPERMFAPGDLAAMHRALDLTAHPGVEPPQGDDIAFLITGWGSPRLDAAALDRLPGLTHVFHTAGSVRALLAPEVWRRGIVVTSAAEANAVPVAEFTLGWILLAGKAVPDAAAVYRSSRGTVWADPDAYAGPAFARVGNYRRVVGIISASSIGRRVMALLAPFDLEVLLFDPYVSDADAAALGATKVELAELFARSDVVSLHAPDLPATRGMVTRELLASLPDGATFINTARPAIVDQDGLVAVLKEGRHRAILDVTTPEPLPADHPLWELPNVTLTPHWAGSQGLELHRMGRMAVDAVADVLAGRRPRGEVTSAMLATMA
ncbi:hydroxyacid dehydrogenase [Propioniciclava soli]|uniref:Hydroxyacid dehydrogenase n=1 Tax=Propioniciclava soli TaxID=2775081 RepID=A0ABZ3C5H9_9ACTN